ncbi:MAG TPA: cupin domain-containing protein [Acidobacteriaceae bacterium]|jgi:quercetin dioxygenase-like cupin family protein|nr:cupin domain-containing protein [Acidobacteriaceae bacterium]
MNNSTIQRKPLMKAALDSRQISTVDAREIRFAPGQQTGRHLHPCTVVGYVVEGTAAFQIEGEIEQILPAGSAFHEPRGTVIADFRNASDSAPMTFITFYLLDGQQELITMLETRPEG